MGGGDAFCEDDVVRGSIDFEVVLIEPMGTHSVNEGGFARSCNIEQDSVK